MAMGSSASAGRAKDWSRRASGEIFSSVGFLFAGIGGSAPFIAGQPVDICRYFILSHFRSEYRRASPNRHNETQATCPWAPRICRAKTCAPKSSMLGDPCLVVAPLSLTSFLVFRFRTASRFFAAKSRTFGKRLRRPFEFWGFRFGGARG